MDLSKLSDEELDALERDISAQQSKPLEEMTDDELDALEAQLSGAASPPEESSALRTGSLIAGNLNKGIANLAGLPVDLVNSALGTVGLGSEKPFGGSESIQSLMDKFGDTPEARGPGERILARGAQELGASVLPMGATLRAAKAGTQAVTPLLRPLVGGAAAAPGRYVAGEAAAAAGAGAGAGVAREYTGTGEDDSWRGQIADFVGAVVGGLGPTGIAEIARAVNRHVPLTEGGKQASAASSLGMKAEEAARLSEAEEAAPNVPGMQFAPAELLNDPRLLAEKKRLDVSSPEAARDEAARRLENNQALAAAAQEGAPSGDVDAPRTAVARQAGAVEDRLAQAEAAAQARGVEAVAQAEAGSAASLDAARNAAAERTARAADTATDSVEAARLTAAERAEQLRAQQDEALAPLRADVDAAVGDLAREPAARKAAASRTGRAELEAAEEEVEQQASRLFKIADPDNKLLVQTTPLSQAVDDVLETAASRGREDALPAILRGGDRRPAEIGAFLGEQPLQRLNGLRSRLGEDIRSAQREGRRQEASFLIQLQRALDDSLEAEIEDQISVKMAAGETDVARDLERERDQWLAGREAARAGGVGARTGTTGAAGGSADAGASLRGSGPQVGRLDAGLQGAEASGTGGRDGGSSETGAAPDRRDAAKALRTARSFFRDNVAQTFRQGRVGKTLKVGADNRPAVAPENTLGQFVADEASINDFVKAVGGRPAAVRAMNDYALSDMVQYATDTAGKIVPRKVAAWRKKYEPVLKAFPEVDKFTGNVQKLQERVTAAEKAAADAGKAADREGREAVRGAERSARDATRQAEREGRAEVRAAERSGRQAVKAAATAAKEDVAKQASRKKRSLGAIEKSAAQFWLDRTPEKAVAGILSSGNPVQAAKEAIVVVRKGGGQEATDGVARAAWDHTINRIFSSVEEGGIKSAIGAKFLKDNEAALRILMGDEKLKRAQEMLKAAQINARAGKAVAGTGSDTAQKGGSVGRIVLDAAKQNLSVLAGAAAGLPLGGPIGAVIGGTAAKSAELYAVRQRHAVQELMREALNDPATFRLLTNRVTRDNEDAIARALKAKLAAFGIRQAAAYQGSDDD